MLRSRFLWKLYAGYVAVILLCTAILGVLVVRQMERSSEADLDRSLRSQAALLRELATPALSAGEIDEGFQQRVRDLGRNNGVRYTVIASGGEVLADSEREPSRMENHRSRPEVIQADEHGEGRSSRFSATVQADMSYLALPVDGGGRRLGFVRVAVRDSTRERHLGEVRSLIFAGAGGAAVIGLLLGFLLARRMTDPLRSITAAAESIAQGHYDREVYVHTDDEIGKLAVAFNHMAGNLRERIETLDRERHQVVAILGSMVEGLVAVDAEERVVHMNAAAAVFFDVASHKTIGKPIWETVRVPAVIEAVRRVMTAHRDITSETRIATPRELVMELHAAPLTTSEGALEGAVVVMHDVTELRRLEAVRRDFVANVSHELKTPLTAIRGIVETLLDDESMDADTRQRFLGKVKSQVDRLSMLVSDLLVLSRVESTRGLQEREPIDLGAVMREVARLVQTEAETKGLRVDLQVPEKPIVVLGEEEALQQMLTNLLSNAIKYTQRGGRVWLRLMAEEDDARIEVQDTGIGIERRHLDRIFERFYRVDKARSRELGGTGLGLSIVKHIALGFGGSVTVESQPGKGTVFRVRLPLARD